MAFNKGLSIALGPSLIWGGQIFEFCNHSESRISGMSFKTQMAGEFSISQILLKLSVKWPLVKAFQLHYVPAWSEMVRFSSFVIILESRMYFESQLAGEFSMSQILLKLGVKWPLVKAFQLHYVSAWSEMVRFSSIAIILESRMYFETRMSGEFSMSQILMDKNCQFGLVILICFLLCV